MAYTGISGSAILVMLLLLLTANRWRHWSAGILTAVLIASLALTNEIAFLLIGFGFVLVILAWMIAHRSYQIAARYFGMDGDPAGAVLGAILQGGMLTEIVRARFSSGLKEPAISTPRPASSGRRRSFPRISVRLIHF